METVPAMPQNVPSGVSDSADLKVLLVFGGCFV